MLNCPIIGMIQYVEANPTEIRAEPMHMLTAAFGGSYPYDFYSCHSGKHGMYLADPHGIVPVNMILQRKETTLSDLSIWCSSNLKSTWSNMHQSEGGRVRILSRLILQSESSLWKQNSLNEKKLVQQEEKFSCLPAGFLLAGLCFKYRYVTISPFVFWNGPAHSASSGFCHFILFDV